MKKILVVCLLVVVAGSMVFAGGSSESDAKEDSSSKVELNFWSWRTEDVEVYNELIDIFEAKNPGIEVNFTAYKNTEYNTILSAAIKGGSGPDILHLRTYGSLETLAKPGYLMPLEDKVPELSGFGETVLLGATSVSDGKIYGVPFASQTLVIYYNKAIYTELGLQVPETWDEFIANLDIIKAAGYTGLANGGKDGWTLEILHGVVCPNFYGANDFFNEVVAGDTDFTDDRYKGSLEKLLELRPYMPDNFMGIAYTDMQMLFINEMAAHFIGGSWEAGYFGKENVDLDFDVFAGPVAEKGDTRYVSSFADSSFGMSANTKNSKEAIAFLRFMATAEAGQFLTDKLTMKSDAPGVVFSDPFLGRIGDLNENNTPYIMLVGFRYDKPTGSELLQSLLQGMMSGSIDSHEVVSQVQEGVSSWYKPFQD